MLPTSLASLARGIDRPHAALPGERAVDDPALIQAFYEAHGGLASSDAIAGLLRRQTPQPISVLARWIVGRNVVVLARHPQTLLPLFQFDLDGMFLRADVQRVLPLLAAVLDDWEVAAWFARPNACLAGDTPVAALRHDPAAVWQAALVVARSAAH